MDVHSIIEEVCEEIGGDGLVLTAPQEERDDAIDYIKRTIRDINEIRPESAITYRTALVAATMVAARIPPEKHEENMHIIEPVANLFNTVCFRPFFDKLMRDIDEESLAITIRDEMWAAHELGYRIRVAISIDQL